MKRLCDYGFAIASIDYRLTDQAKWSAQVEDCRAAVAFLKAEQTRLKIFADRVGACGSSAGGHLVALMGTLDQSDAQQKRSGVVAVCDYFGPTDLLTMPKNIAADKKQIKACNKTFAAPIKVGQWQTYDLTLVDRHITVVLNGETVVESLAPHPAPSTPTPTPQDRSICKVITPALPTAMFFLNL